MLSAYIFHRLWAENSNLCATECKLNTSFTSNIILVWCDIKGYYIFFYFWTTLWYKRWRSAGRRCSIRTRRRSSVQTRNHVVLTCDPTSLGNDADSRSRDRLRHFRLQSPAEVDGVGSARYGCQLYRSFVDDCDICRSRRAAADGSPTPPTSSDFRSNGGPKMAAIDSGCDVIRTVTSSSTGSAVTARALECPECLAESGRTLQLPAGRDDTVGPLAIDSQHPRSAITIWPF